MDGLAGTETSRRYGILAQNSQKIRGLMAETARANSLPNVPGQHRPGTGPPSQPPPRLADVA